MKDVTHNTHEQALPDYLASEESLAKFHSLPISEKEWIVDRGVPKSYIVKFKELTGLTYEDLATIFMVTSRLLHIKKGNEKLNLMVSNQFVALLEIYSLGIITFGTMHDFQDWLNHPNEMAGRKEPIKLLNFFPGIILVRDLLYSILTGQPSIK